MNHFLILIYLAALGVSIALEMQSRKHRAGIALECARAGIPLPPERPKIETLEALLNIAIGLVLLAPAAMTAWSIFTDTGLREHTPPGMGDFYAFLIAAGVTLIILGGIALGQNIRRGPHRAAAGQSRDRNVIQ
ncbi:MAG TPA: hypothetical protein VK569_09255 [Bacteroidota bacterium]|nr:hypothetical protein [Bacteroidota bacterium]